MPKTSIRLSHGVNMCLKIWGYAKMIFCEDLIVILFEKPYNFICVNKFKEIFSFRYKIV